MSNLKITIPKPCSENWENMKQLEQSRFCALCEKEVLDFTKFSIPELQDYFRTPKGNVCGRISQNQLHDFIPSQSQSNRFNYLSYKLFVASCLALLISTKSYSNEVFEDNIYQDDKHSIKAAIVEDITDSLITVTGIIMSKEDGLPIPGVSVSVKNGLNITTTDFEGRFKIQIKFGANQKVILISKCLGYETVETEVLSMRKEDLQIKLSQSFGLMGEVLVIAGGISVKRSIGSRIDNLFRKLFTGRH